jgi:hypothetical protein
MADPTTQTNITPPTPPATGDKQKGLKPYLKGLTFRTSKAVEMKDENGKPVMVGGKPRMTYMPVERELQEGDVLSVATVGDQMVIVTKDGRKYRVEK